MQVFYLHVAYLKCTHKHCNRFFESHYYFGAFTHVLFSKYLLCIFIYAHKHEKHKMSRLFGVTKLKKSFAQKDMTTMTTNIARKEQMQNHKENYKRVK